MHYLLGLGIGLALERRGVTALHGGAVGINGNAVAIVGGSQNGKTTLALEMVAQGAKLLTEDLVALHRSPNGAFQVFPGPTQVRLWPDSAQHLSARMPLEDLARVHTELQELQPQLRRPRLKNLLYKQALT